jgi:hypothetical protein
MTIPSMNEGTLLYQRLWPPGAARGVGACMK